jgi:DNA-binding IclR family transcriptional regulator
VRILERIAKGESPIATGDLIRELALPKPTVHRIIVMLESAGLVQRDPVAKRLIVGARLQALALDVVVRSTQYGPRHHILARLARDTGETSTFTIFERGDMLVVDRVESAWPLRVNLFPGSHVPMYCTASGKLMLAMMTSEARERLLRSMRPLRSLAPNTVTRPKELAAMLPRIRAEAVSTDNEEFMAGLVAIAVPVMHPAGKQMIGALSLNAPAARMSVQRARRHLPVLRRAALALSENLRGEPKPRVVAAGHMSYMRRKVS